MPLDLSPHWLEILNWLAGVAVAIFAGFSLRQLSILKTDISIRNERSAKEKAVEAAEAWADAQEHIRPYIRNCDAAGLPNYYDGPITDFLFESLPDDWKVTAALKEKIEGWAKPLNRIEAIAAMLTKGVADEQTGFQIFGRDYCLCVGAICDVISANRIHRSQPLYSNTVELYQLWKERLTVAELRDQQTITAEQLSGLNPRTISPIGVDRDS